MTNKNQNQNKPASQETERRSFIKNLAVGTVAAGAIAGGVVNTSAANVQREAAQLTIKPRKATATLRLSFNQKRKPSLDDVYAALERVLRETGCTKCGFDGLDVILRLDSIINPVIDEPVAILEGEIPGF